MFRRKALYKLEERMSGLAYPWKARSRSHMRSRGRRVIATASLSIVLSWVARGDRTDAARTACIACDNTCLYADAACEHACGAQFVAGACMAGGQSCPPTEYEVICSRIE